MDARISSRPAVVVAVIATVLGLLWAPVASGPSVGADVGPLAIAAGPDGTMWFTESGSAATGIGRITPAGVVTEFVVPDSSSVHRWAIAAGPDGTMWFTETFAMNGIGRITPDGVVTRYPVSGAAPTGIAAGPDGEMWWASEGMIGKISATGTITEYPLPEPTGYTFRGNGIVAGPDGNMWFTQVERNRIGRITPDGVLAQFAVPTPWSRPQGIAAGPDGNLWFTESSGNSIGRITPDGAITEYPLPTANSSSHGIAAGPDGAMWFTEPGSHKIGRISTDGVITEYQLTKAGSAPQGIAAGPDGNMWFTVGADRIGRITPAGTITEFPIPSAFPAAVKTPCLVNVTLHKPIPTTAGNRILTDRITTNATTCRLRQPVVRCQPLSNAAGKKAICATKVSARGRIRVTTPGLRTVRVTVKVRATPRAAFTDTWKPDTWRRTWTLRNGTGKA